MKNTSSGFAKVGYVYSDLFLEYNVFVRRAPSMTTRRSCEPKSVAVGRGFGIGELFARPNQNVPAVTSG